MDGRQGGRRRRWLLAGGTIALLGLMAATLRLFVWPGSATPGRADAVVVFAGGRGDRLPAAVRLVERGVAPTLVISNGLASIWDDAGRLCRGGAGARVLCPTPDPQTTAGEARMFADLAERNGWRSLVLVTSAYHLRRADLLLRRCFAGEVQAVAARPRPSLSLVTAIGHEWLGLADALTLHRRC